MNTYGKELILDVYDCNSAKFNRKDIEQYFKTLCDDKIDMIRCDLHWWDFEGEQELYDAAPPHLKGTSAVQFIQTSNIVIHTLDDLGRVYINIFSCKDFDETVAREFTEKTFEGHTINNEGKGLTIWRI